jgi:hypothetical protein
MWIAETPHPRAISRPFRLHRVLRRYPKPRALPWAEQSQAFGPARRPILALPEQTVTGLRIPVEFEDAERFGLRIVFEPPEVVASSQGRPPHRFGLIVIRSSKSARFSGKRRRTRNATCTLNQAATAVQAPGIHLGTSSGAATRPPPEAVLAFRR